MTGFISNDYDGAGGHVLVTKYGYLSYIAHKGIVYFLMLG